MGFVWCYFLVWSYWELVLFPDSSSGNDNLQRSLDQLREQLQEQERLRQQEQQQLQEQLQEQEQLRQRHQQQQQGSCKFLFVWCNVINLSTSVVRLSIYPWNAFKQSSTSNQCDFCKQLTDWKCINYVMDTVSQLVKLLRFGRVPRARINGSVALSNVTRPGP